MNLLVRQLSYCRIVGIPISADRHLTKVDLRTWGVEVAAVCHIPPVSKVSVAFDLDPGGVLIWQASSWHGEVGQDELEVLRALFLVKYDESLFQRLPRGNPRGEYHPATFEGVATLTSVKDPPRTSRIKLGPDNFELTPASRCPDPEKPKT